MIGASLQSAAFFLCGRTLMACGVVANHAAGAAYAIAQTT